MMIGGLVFAKGVLAPTLDAKLERPYLDLSNYEVTVEDSFSKLDVIAYRSSTRYASSICCIAHSQ